MKQYQNGLRSLSEELNKDETVLLPVVVDVADWDSLRQGFEKAVSQFQRIDYIFPIAGVGETRTFPNNPASTGFQPPDLRAFEVNMNGFLYTISLALQQFRRQSVNELGFRGKRGLISISTIEYSSFMAPHSHRARISIGVLQHALRPHVRSSETGNRERLTRNSAQVGFVRSFGTYLADEEKIFINVICPNKIRTGLNTAEAFDKIEAAGVPLIEMKTVLDEVEKLLGSNSLSGAIIEIAPKIGSVVREPPAFINRESERSAEMTLELARPLHQVVR
ncbi:glucose 1-dehydrogenase [Fonsecaea pedrosoi]|nr:glucose 1-dehydrogenase [Fonsecaea pedrosoi]